MESDAIKIKRLISMILIKKKSPEEIEKIILSSSEDYAKSAKKLIEAIKELNLNDAQKEKIEWIESYNENDCKEGIETLKYVSLTQYENKKEDIQNALEAIIDKSVQENKKTEKSSKAKKIKIDYKKVDNAIKDKRANFDYSNQLINQIMDEIKSSKKGLLKYLSTIKFLEEQQKKVDKYVKRFDEETQLAISSTLLKTVKVSKALDIQDGEISKELIESMKNYSVRHEQEKEKEDFQHKREVFVENLHETISNIKKLQNENEDEYEEERDILQELERDDK